ncbi:odorant receptor 131-2-like [Pseudoliparis swirei]|uniref:odorant receptor 131-2-like n=1 Tax=Pseudoliparis swirei TaxID=2059687 RepID=UPI0024BE5751|nr:odorant receptor 131-2-like [Pseudoliparis swirei]
MNNTTEVIQVMRFQTSFKVLLSMLPCFLFLYVNAVMLYALLSKPLLLESPRYMLFGHLLLTESLQLFGIMLLYIFAVTLIRMISFVCLMITVVVRITVKISPLNLAVMSVERYVAVCFPLRHANMFTTRLTKVAIAVMWTVASLDSFALLFLFISLEKSGFTVRRSCHRHIFQLQMYSTINRDFTIAFFVIVCMVAIYTYIAVMITVKSASSTVRNSSKPHKTMLLHLIQLCLCLTSTLFNMINSTSMLNKNLSLAITIQYVLFLTLIIFPKCLSPLIYGLRDRTFRHVFIYYFTFGLKPPVKTFPKS